MYSPKYSINNQILKNIGSIEASKEIIDHAPLLPFYEREFQKDALIRTIHFGTHIEGNELNLNQAEKVLAGVEIPGRQRDIQEVINYRKVMTYIDQFKDQNSNIQINEELIKHLHNLTVEKILPLGAMWSFQKNSSSCQKQLYR